VTEQENTPTENNNLELLETWQNLQNSVVNEILSKYEASFRQKNYIILSSGYDDKSIAFKALDTFYFNLLDISEEYRLKSLRHTKPSNVLTSLRKKEFADLKSQFPKEYPAYDLYSKPKILSLELELQAFIVHDNHIIPIDISPYS
jgi:hypothetical protein